ncbi:MAG: hypothetical protein IAE87_05735 [Rhodobacteraceae bacterium]|nr:hypothetical protein [Paracoccaceae bacterium]
MTEAFLAAIRPLFGGRIAEAQIDGLTRLLAATAGLPVSQSAYILATAFHETAGTMQPIREYGRGRGRRYGAVDATGKAPYGRGYVQLTWRENYVRADRELGLGGRLAADYDLALEPDLAARILVDGMREGWFTGRRLADYLPGDYEGARRVVNGTDRAAEIATLARRFEAALAAGQVPAPVPGLAGLLRALARIVARILLRLGAKA